jgi:glycine/D-amino acid oxidase-like deaminating enzyme
MRIEPSIYLEALVRDFTVFGGRTVIRKFDTPRDLATLSEAVIVNCTGLGSYELFDDKELIPVKGQLTVMVPQQEVDYQTSGGLSVPSTPGIGIHMMPRSDGIVLGGTAQRGVWTLEPDLNERKRVVEGHIELFSTMRRLRQP